MTLAPSRSSEGADADWYAAPVSVAARLRRRAVAPALVLPLLLAALAGCGDSSPDAPGKRAAAMYEQIIRWFVDERWAEIAAAAEEATDDTGDAAATTDAPPTGEAEAEASIPEEAAPLQVFVEPRGEGATISLGVQADVVATLQDVADVRFIDDLGEALETNDEGTVVVVGDGILLRLPPVPEQGRSVTLEVDRFGAERFTTMEFTLRKRENQWSVVGDPVVTGTRPM